MEDVSVAPCQGCCRCLGPGVLVDLLVYPAPVILDILPQPGHHGVTGRAGGLGKIENSHILIWEMLFNVRINHHYHFNTKIQEVSPFSVFLSSLHVSKPLDLIEP